MLKFKCITTWVWIGDSVVDVAGMAVPASEIDAGDDVDAATGTGNDAATAAGIS